MPLDEPVGLSCLPCLFVTNKQTNKQSTNNKTRNMLKKVNSRPKGHALVSICVSPFFPYAIEETDFQMITTDYFNVMIAENSFFFPVLIKVHNCPDYECMKFCVQSLLTSYLTENWQFQHPPHWIISEFCILDCNLF